MKYAYILILASISCTIFGCKKDYQGDSYDFSSSALPYADLKTKSFTVSLATATSVKVTARLRTAFAIPTNVNYKLGGALSGTGSIVVPANAVEGAGTINIPASALPSGQASATGTLTLTSAQNADTQLTIGYLTTSEVATITIKP